MSYKELEYYDPSSFFDPQNLQKKEKPLYLGVSFYFFSIAMSLSQITQTWRRYYILLALFTILALVAWSWAEGYSYYLERQIHLVDQGISQKKSQISELLSEANFQHYLQIKDLTSQNTQIPWSNYVYKILEILESIKAVQEERGGVELSDFKVDLNKLSLNGVVSNLRILYGNRENKGGLLDSFNQLEFLKDITIRKYQKSPENPRAFEFTLSANVINHATSGSTTHK